MIGDFSSFIELCAAVYFTMCLDSDKFKLFWNPKRKVSVENVTLQASIDQSVEKIRDNEILGLRRMGVFMIVICFLLLILVGFEQTMSGDSNRFSVPIIITYGIIFILELIHNAIFKLMKVVVLSLVFILAVFLTLWFWDGLNSSLQCEAISNLYKKLDLLTTGVLIFPLVVHVGRLWFRSSVQSSYVRSKVEAENNEYQNAIQALIIGKPSGVSKKYLTAWDKVENPKDPDPDTTPFTELFVNSVADELYPSGVKLIVSLVGHRTKKIIKIVLGLFGKK